MKKAILILTLILMSCSSDDSDTFSVVGKNYRLISFTLEHSFDLNNDNIYSYDYLEEASLFCDPEFIYFTEDGILVGAPTYNAFGFRSATDENGNLIQDHACFRADSNPIRYSEKTNELIAGYNLSESGDQYTGVLSDNNNVLTFYIPNYFLWGLQQGWLDFNDSLPLGNEILNEDGSLTYYNGDAVVVYRLTEIND